MPGDGPCPPCARFPRVSAAIAAERSLPYAGGVVLELARGALQLFECGRTAEGAAMLRGLLLHAGLVPSPSPAAPAGPSQPPPHRTPPPARPGSGSTAA